MTKTLFNASKAPADGGKQFLRVREIVEHFPGLSTFFFEADGVRTKRLAPQRAGNYIALTAKVGESRVTRAYTLASSPKEAEGGVYISTVKKAGILSSHLVDVVKAGDVLKRADLPGILYTTRRETARTSSALRAARASPLCSPWRRRRRRAASLSA